MNGMPSFAAIPSAAGDVELQLLDSHAGSGDEEERPVEPDVEPAEFHAATTD